MSRVISMRFGEDQIERLGRLARQLGKSPSETSALLVEGNEGVALEVQPAAHLMDVLALRVSRERRRVSKWSGWARNSIASSSNATRP